MTTLDPVPVDAGTGRRADLAQGYKRAVLGTRSDQTVRAAFVNELVPPASSGAYANAPRVVRNAFVDEWYGRDDDVRRMRGELAERMGKAMQEDTLHELLVIAGEVAGAIDEVLPAAEIVGRMAAGAEQVLRELTGA